MDRTPAWPIHAPRETCNARFGERPAPSVAEYDSFAAAYSASNENNLFNAYYARPEMMRLAGDVAGLEVLDAGCGSGPLMEAVRGKDPAAQ